MKSIYHNLGGNVAMPQFSADKLYMHKTNMDNVILPNSFKHYTETISSILNKVKNRNDVCYITIDEKQVKNETHRRGGIHVDFNWFENLNGHSGHKIMNGNHNGGGSGTHGQPHEHPRTGGHNSGGSGGHSGITPVSPNTGGHGNNSGTHASMAEFNKNGGMLLVSNYAGCSVYRGNFYGTIGDGGCCKNIDVSGLEKEIMKPNEVYYLNALGIHESLKIGEANRTLVRINFHPDYVWE